MDQAKKIGTCECRKLKAIMMDCEMPVKNGFEATLELVELMDSELIKEVPIIACTAFRDEGQRNKCLECGMRAFMTKPVITDDLKKTLQKCNVID